MAIKEEDGQFSCPTCFKKFNRLVLADSCEKSHNTIYVPMQRSDIDKLIQFIFTGDQRLLKDMQPLVKTLMKYTKVKEVEKDEIGL